MFARHPVSKLKARVPKRLLSKNLAFFLERRTLNRHGAPDVLPPLIRAIVNEFVSITGVTTDTARASWIKKVAGVIAAHCYEASKSAIAPTVARIKDYNQDPLKSNALLVATYLKDDAMVSKLLAQGTDPWTGPLLFRKHFLHEAISSKNSRMIDLFLAHAGLPQNESLSKTRVHVFSDAIVAASIDDWTLATRMLEWNAKHLPKLSPSASRQLVKKAVVNGALEFLRSMQDLGYLHLKKRPHTREIIQGLLTSSRPTDLLQHFNDRAFLSFYNHYRIQDNDEARVLIDLATYNDSLGLAKAVIDVSNTTGHFLTCDCDEALREAISRNDTDMVDLLLAEGADPEARECDGRGSTYELARPGSEVQLSIRVAIAMKVREWGDEYEMPKHLVWDAKKQKDVYQAYTLTPPTP